MSDQNEEARIRNLKRALNEFDRLASALDLPRSVRTIGTALYRRARQENLLPGRGVEEVVAAALYIGCKQEGVPRNPDDFAKQSKYERKSILRTSKYLESELGLDLQPFDPEPYIDRINEQVEIDEKTITEAKAILSYGMQEGVVSGWSPSGAAASAVYLAVKRADESITQLQLAQMVDVTEVTIRNRYQELEESLPDNWNPI